MPPRSIPEGHCGSLREFDHNWLSTQLLGLGYGCGDSGSAAFVGTGVATTLPAISPISKMHIIIEILLIIVVVIFIILRF